MSATARRTSWLGLLLLALCTVACAGQPTGPPFVSASPPPDHRGRIYVFRIDERRSMSTVRVQIDGRELGTFRDREYETLEVASGTHQLKAGMRSLGWLNWGWNEQRVRVQPGETVFVEISVRLAAHPTPGTRELEIGGRPSTSASENVFVRILPEAKALGPLRTTTRLAAGERGSSTPR